MKSVKHKLYQACLEFTDTQISTLKSAIKATQQSANEETKSTAGDKYETGRAMAQLEVEKFQSQLAEALKMKQKLQQISVEENTDIVRPGSIVFTSLGNFYIAINTGQHQIDNMIFHTVSAASPIAQKLLGLKVGEIASHNHQEFTLVKIQ